MKPPKAKPPALMSPMPQTFPQERIVAAPPVIREHPVTKYARRWPFAIRV
jgi:hypothetical protein